MKTSEFHFEDFRQAGQAFLRRIVAKLTDLGVPGGGLPCDHLCFRVGTREEYDFYKTAIAGSGRLLTEAQVNGRAISTFRLNSPFRTETHEVPLVELPSPKDGTPFSTGFEHAEFVIPECLTRFHSRFPGLDFKIGGHPTLNPELGLKLGEGMQAKFHHLSLERVIEIEDAGIEDVIFDFDGTLIRSRETIHEVNRIVFSEALGREVSIEESIANFHAEFPKLFEAYAVTCPVRQKEALANWGAISNRFSYALFDDVAETLEALHRQGFRLHLWTARDESSARKILQAHDLERFFMTMSFATERDSKPHAGSLRFDWRQAGRDQVLVVGDSPTDLRGAKNIAAIGGAALWDPHAKRGALIEAGAELFFHRLTDVRDWLERGRGHQGRSTSPQGTVVT